MRCAPRSAGRVRAPRGAAHRARLGRGRAPHQVVLERVGARARRWSTSRACRRPSAPAELERLLREHARAARSTSRSDLMLRDDVVPARPRGARDPVPAPSRRVRRLGGRGPLPRPRRALRRPARTAASRDLPELPLQYRDFARRQRERLQGELLERELDFWRAQLAGAPTVLRLPTDQRRPADADLRGRDASPSISTAELADARARALPAAEHVTPYMLLLAAFATLLYRRSGQDDILFGGPMANRDEPGLEHADRLLRQHDRGAVPPRREPDVRRAAAHACASRCSPPTSTRRCRSSSSSMRSDRSAIPASTRSSRSTSASAWAPAPALELDGATTTPSPSTSGSPASIWLLELHVLDDRHRRPSSTTTRRCSSRPRSPRLATDFERLLRAAVTDPTTRLLSFELGEEPAPAGASPERPGIRRSREGSGSTR